MLQTRQGFQRRTTFPVGHGRVGVTQARVLEYSAVIREELGELSDAAKSKMWGESFWN